MVNANIQLILKQERLIPYVFDFFMVMKSSKDVLLVRSILYSAAKCFTLNCGIY